MDLPTEGTAPRARWAVKVIAVLFVIARPKRPEATERQPFSEAVSGGGTSPHGRYPLRNHGTFLPGRFTWPPAACM